MRDEEQVISEGESGGRAYEEPQVEDEFHVTSAEAASWVVRKVLEARAYRRRVEAWAAAELARSEREEAFFLGRFGGELEAWLRQEVARHGGRRRSVNLPSGVVGLRRTPSGVDVTDEQRLVEWCKKCLPEAVLVKETAVKAVVVGYVQSTGDVPDGIAIRDGVERLYLR